MDHDFHGTSSSKPLKRDSPDSLGYGDHSPNADDILRQPHHKMNTSDDFEHIHSDKLLDTDYDLLGSSSIHAPPATNKPSQAQNLIDDFSFNEGGSPTFGTPIHHKTATTNFLEGERGGGLYSESNFDSFNSAFGTPAVKPAAPAPAMPPPSPPKAAASLLDDIQDDYLNPYATGKKPDEFKLSDDELITQDIEQPKLRTKTPDLFHEQIAPVIHQQEIQKVPDFAARPKPPVDQPPPPPVPAPAPRDESPVPPIPRPEPVKAFEPPKKVEASKAELIKPEPVRPVEPPKKVEPKMETVKKPEAAIRKTKEQITGAEEIFYRYGLGMCSFLYFKHYASN